MLPYGADIFTKKYAENHPKISKYQCRKSSENIKSRPTQFSQLHVSSSLARVWRQSGHRGVVDGIPSAGCMCRTSLGSGSDIPEARYTVKNL